MHKKASDIVSNFAHLVKPEKIIYAVWNNGESIKLPIPCLAKEITCPMCGGTKGYYIPFDKSWSCDNFSCVKLNNKKSANVVYFPPKMTIDRTGVPEDLQNAHIKDIIDKEYIPIIETFCSNFSGTLLIAGKCGIGKSYLAAACVQKYLSKKNDCKFVNCSNLYLSWLEAKRSFGDLSLHEKYAQTELLILDDLGVTAPKDGYLEFLYCLINKRFTEKKFATIITTNLNAKQISELFGSQILSRICSGIIIKHKGEYKRKDEF